VGILGLAAFAPQLRRVYTAWAEKDAPLASEKQARIAKAGIEVVGKMGVPG